MLARRFVRILLAFFIVIAIALTAGFLWLRTTPMWAGITLFSESKRVENFRRMDLVFPSLPVPRAGDVWAFRSDPKPLPETFDFENEARGVEVFLQETTTSGLIVIRDGVILFEDYWLGADETSTFTSWSLAKSMMATLFAHALEEGHIASLDDSIETYVKALAGTPYGSVSLRDALTMSSGIAFDENYDAFGSDVNQIFSKLAQGIPLEDVLGALPKEREAGIYNNYISSDSIALGLVLEAATGEPLHEYFQSRIWAKMGAEADAFWNTGRASGALAFCCMNATLRDYARFGRLYQEGGMRDGVEIIPGDWVKAATKPEAAHLQPGDNPASSWTFGYGYHWWVPEGSTEDYTGIGIWGQYIYVDPARDVVIVKTSVDEGFDDRDYETVALLRRLAAWATEH